MSAPTIVFPTIAEIQDFFFDAARATYASGTAKATIPQLPHSKVYCFARDAFRYVDIYFKHNERSGGQTMIYFQDVPVWLMQYQGWCENDDPEVIALLKEALRYAYEHRLFYGGRGPSTFPLASDSRWRPDRKGKLLVYHNEDRLDPAGHSPIDNFMGRERIEMAPDPRSHMKTVFWHRYQGMLLIPSDKAMR